jgi:ABC-type branched-subunit amino acid transport system substrate-binding protein
VALSISTTAAGAADTLPTFRGFLLAMEDAAARTDLGVDLSWEMFDDGGDITRTAALAEQVVDDAVFVAVIGPMGSTEAFANAPVFDRAGILQISPCAAHPELCDRGWHTFHRLVSNERVRSRHVAAFAFDDLLARNAGLVHDDVFGDVADSFAAAFQDRGGVCQRISFDAAAFSPAALAARMAVSGADVFVVVAGAHEAALISQAARNAGVGVPFLGFDALDTSFLLGGGDGRGDAYHAHGGVDMGQLASALEFRQRYIARFPEDSKHSPEAYDAATLVVAAIRAAGRADRAAVHGALHGLGTFDGITGPISFTPTGERVIASTSFYKVEATAEGGRAMVYRRAIEHG